MHIMRTNFIFKAAAAAATAAAALLTVSCGKDSTVHDTPQAPEGEVLGTYEFDGKTYDILRTVIGPTGKNTRSPMTMPGKTSTTMMTI